MGRYPEESPSPLRRLEAAAWWVEFDSGGLRSEEQKGAWREWSCRPENQRAYEELARIPRLLCALARPPDVTVEELQGVDTEAHKRME